MHGLNGWRVDGNACRRFGDDVTLGRDDDVALGRNYNFGRDDDAAVVDDLRLAVVDDLRLRNDDAAARLVRRADAGQDDHVGLPVGPEVLLAGDDAVHCLGLDDGDGRSCSRHLRLGLGRNLRLSLGPGLLDGGGRHDGGCLSQDLSGAVLGDGAEDSRREGGGDDLSRGERRRDNGSLSRSIRDSLRSQQLSFELI